MSSSLNLFSPEEAPSRIWLLNKKEDKKKKNKKIKGVSKKKSKINELGELCERN